MTTTPTFHEARDLLLRHRTDYDSAYREFRWPVLERFNWALDHFDAIARGNESTALHIVGEDGSETRRSFAEMSVRSSQVANHLRGLGVKRGDRILLMLGNELALWEVMLASIKLGAVVIPATSLLTTDDLRDRLERGAVRHIVTSSALAAKFADLPGRFTRVAIGAPVAGWQDYADSEKAATAFVADGETRADDP
ncbi:MAG TPA: AMP-binding protein, partial [Caldimonas sp.]|nr:AMP-binding protein [Caldimonas sp.]